jgi:hypothetical protein
VFATPLYAVRVPDITTGSKFYLDNKGTSDNAAMFTEELREELQKDSSTKKYRQPGFPVVEKKEEADYILRFVLVTRGNDNHARLKVWLLDPKGTTLWEGEHECSIMTTFFLVPNCAQFVSSDLKAAQVDAEGKRAGALGWKNK